MTSDLSGPVIYFIFSAVLIGIGTSRWVGWWKSWYLRPGIRERRIQWALGQSPLPLIFFGIPFLLIDTALLALVLGAGLLTLLFPIAGLVSIVLGVVLVIARPKRALPPWVRRQIAEDAERGTT
jgi:hypothetical protein